MTFFNAGDLKIRVMHLLWKWVPGKWSVRSWFLRPVLDHQERFSNSMKTFVEQVSEYEFRLRELRLGERLSNLESGSAASFAVEQRGELIIVLKDIHRRLEELEK